MYLEKYLSQLNNQGLETSVLDVSKQIDDNVKKFFTFKDNVTGLLFGNVQSGKTAQMLGAIARFADEGYMIFLLLTSDNVDLQRQTFLRTQSSLIDFNVLSERDDLKFLQDGLRKPTVIVLKKNGRILKKWREILLSCQSCKGKFLMIFDDEGDNASLNTLVNKNRQSTINKNLDAIKDSASSCVYFEVTATPQSLILQSEISGWHPKFVNYFKPGKGYLGGDFFYADPKPFCIKFTKENELDDVTTEDDNYCPEGLQESILYFLIECAHKKLKGETNCNFMIHPSIRTGIHSKFATRVEEHLNLLQEAYGEKDFIQNLKMAWADLQKTAPNIESFDDIKDTVSVLLDDMQINVYVLNSKSITGRDPNNPDALDLSKGYNIVVGGNTLGRGITFPHLQIVYYCRASKTPQADTFWQHSRIFGYDREASLVRIFIPKSLYKLFSELSKANMVLIKQIEDRGIDGVQLIYPKGVRPTRSNVLDNKFLQMLSGGVNIFPNEPIGGNTKQIDPLVMDYKDSKVQEVSEELILKLLDNVGSLYREDFDSETYKNCVRALSKKRPKMKYRLIVRIDRDIAKGTGTLLSPNDRALGDNYQNEVVLTLYRVNGDVSKGWNGNPLWVPNIKFPSDCCFYNAE